MLLEKMPHGRSGTFYIKTLGCKVNQYESQVIRESLLSSGYIEAGHIDAADICVINTCTVTSTSDSKSLKAIDTAARKRDRCVIATGCMVEDKDLDLSRLSGVRFIVRNKDKSRIPYLLQDEYRAEGKGHRVGISTFEWRTRAFVKIQDGCDNTCSYCRVRIVRGPSRSRPFKEILDECLRLITNGTKEIVLTGICLGAYGRDIKKGINLSKLISGICNIDGDWRLRLSSIEPKDIDEELIYQLKTQKRLCPHLHIPFQSGDDFILEKMGRPYRRKDYLNTIAELKNEIADIAISTDIMIGFPGETDARFYHTMDFINLVSPMRIHIFPYSRRKGTKAYDYAHNNDISGVIKRERRDKLLWLAQDLSVKFAARFIGREVEVLLEDKKSVDGHLQGYTDRYIKVYLNGPDSLKGQIVKCLHTLTNRKSYGILLGYNFNSPF